MSEQTIGTAWLGDAAGNKKYAHSVTSAVYDPVSGQTLDAVLGEEKLKLLWTNPAPTESFEEQTLSLDLTGYDLINILTTVNSLSNYYTNHVVMKIPDKYQVLVEFFGSQKMHRNIIVSNSGIEFQVNLKYATYHADTAGGTIDNSKNRPIYIYGIKL